MFEEFQNGTNTVINIKCDFVGCENQDSIFCATRDKANKTLFKRGWVVDFRKWKHYCKDHATQHRARAFSQISSYLSEGLAAQQRRGRQ